jgi:hypothetical protein
MDLIKVTKGDGVGEWEIELHVHKEVTKEHKDKAVKLIKEAVNWITMPSEDEINKKLAEVLANPNCLAELLKDIAEKRGR